MEKKNKNVLLIIMGVLILVELAITIKSISLDALTYVPIVASLAFVSLYGFWLYKRPHGSILKYAMLIFSASIILNTVVAAYSNWGSMYQQILRLFAAMIICYCAGRLNRIKENKTYLLVAELLLVVYAITSTVSAMGYVANTSLLIFFSYPVTLLTLIIAYCVRYNEHKEAGVSDK